MLKVSTLVLGLFMMLRLPAQQIPSYLFSYLGVKDGLQEETVFSVQQDNRGYIWVASPSALQRYDGQRFVNFNHRDDDPASIPSSEIRSIQIDKKNRLWILNGVATVGYLDADDFTYHPVKVKLPVMELNRPVTALHVDQDGNVLLICVDKFFITFNEAANEMADKYNPFQLPDGWTPLYIWQDHERNYWIGSHAGIAKYSASKKMLSYKNHNIESDPVIKKYEDLRTVVFAYMDKDHRFWISAWPQNHFTLKSFDFVTGVEKQWVDKISAALKGFYYQFFGISQLRDGSLWMAGQNLFARVNYEANVVEPLPFNAPGEYSIRYDDVSQLFEDREKNLWICTNKGLYRINTSAQVFKTVTNRLPGKDSSLTPDVTDFLQVPGGDILVSTWGNGVFAYDNNFKAVESRYINRTVQGDGMTWCMAARGNGDIWRGVQEGYLFIYEAATGKTKRLRPPVFANSTIRQAAADKKGNMWLGTQRGYLVKWNAALDSFTLYHQFKSIISRVYVDDANDVWVCTDMNGVYRINSNDGSIIKAYHDTGVRGKTLLMNGASDIIQYSDSLYAIAGGGLSLLNKYTGEVTAFTIQNSLPTNNITNLVKDRHGYIWMTSSLGILSYHPIKNKLSTYNAADGIPNNSFNVASSAMLDDGRILFGTNHDFIVFDPAKVTVADYVPPLVDIAGFAIMNNRVNTDSVRKLKQVDLSYTEHSLIIELSTLTYQNRYDIFYMMEGLDMQWMPAGKLNQAVFNYLPPGHYVFKAACKDSDGNIGRITKLDIYINAPFWKTWWFVSLLVLIAGTLLFLFDKARMQRKGTVQKMRADIADNLHKEVNTALNNINILSEMAKLKADDEPKKSKEFIEQIHNKSHNMIIAMDDMLWSISPQNDSMQKTVDRMQEYIDALNNRHSDNIRMLVDEKVKALKLGMQLRHEAFLLFKESIKGLQNAGATGCCIHVALEKSMLSYTIEFNNESCDTRQLNNLLQRQDIVKRLQAVNASMDITVLKSNSVFKLKVPV